MKKVFYFLLFVLLFNACSENSTSNEDINHPPQITSLVSNPDTIETTATSVLTCNADDSDGDNLTFVWDAGSGAINGSGSSVNWISPNTSGVYYVRCKVVDGNGGEDVDSVSIVVEQQLPTQGLIAYYPFNGNANDESGNGNNGSVIGATLANDRFNRPNKSFSFDGNDYIQVNHSVYFDNIENNDNISLSVWIKIIDWYYFNPNSPLFPILDKYESSTDFGWEFLIWNSHFQFYPSVNNTIAVFHNFILNTWYHIVCVYNRNAGIFLVYVDNDLIDSIAMTDDIFDTFGEPLYIGQSKSGDDEFAIGLIDDIRIYNRSLSATEIQALYNEEGWGN